MIYGIAIVNELIDMGDGAVFALEMDIHWSYGKDGQSTLRMCDQLRAMQLTVTRAREHYVFVVAVRIGKGAPRASLDILNALAEQVVEEFLAGAFDE